MVVVATRGGQGPSLGERVLLDLGELAIATLLEPRHGLVPDGAAVLAGDDLADGEVDAKPGSTAQRAQDRGGLVLAVGLDQVLEEGGAVVVLVAARGPLQLVGAVDLVDAVQLAGKGRHAQAHVQVALLGAAAGGELGLGGDGPALGDEPGALHHELRDVGGQRAGDALDLHVAEEELAQDGVELRQLPGRRVDVQDVGVLVEDDVADPVVVPAHGEARVGRGRVQVEHDPVVGVVARVGVGVVVGVEADDLGLLVGLDAHVRSELLVGVLGVGQDAAAELLEAGRVVDPEVIAFEGLPLDAGLEAGGGKGRGIEGAKPHGECQGSE
ncbi:hypothetical protein D3C86_1197850 [compost metagenome]